MCVHNSEGRSATLLKCHLGFLGNKWGSDGRYDMEVSVFKTFMLDWDYLHSRHTNVLGSINMCLRKDYFLFRHFCLFVIKYFILELKIEAVD